MSETVLVGGIPTLRTTRAGLARRMVDDWLLQREGKLPFPRVVTSSNGAIISAYHADPTFRAVMDQADLVDADGMPLVFASWLFHRDALPERVATTDFVLDASAAAAENGIRFFFLGAREGVAEVAAENLKKLHPGLQIVGTRNGYFRPEEEERLCAEIVAAGTDVLWVGLGSPLQESFAIRNRARLKGLTWIRTCGGLFDHWSGRFSRAPIWLQNMGLEWFWRAGQEPGRLGRRYLRTNHMAFFHLLTKTSDSARDRRRRERGPQSAEQDLGLKLPPAAEVARPLDFQAGAPESAVRRRLLLVASTGGHWVQLSRLSPAFEAQDALYVTTADGHEPPSGRRPVVVVPDGSRTSPLRLVSLVARLFWIILRFRPHVVVSTGAAPGLLALRIGRLLGARTVWIDSLANSEQLSLSGRLAEKTADLWLTQWEELAKDKPHLRYFGSVL